MQLGGETSRIARVATHTKKGFSALQKVVSKQAFEQSAPKNDAQTQSRTNQGQPKQNVRDSQSGQSTPKSNAGSNTPSDGSNEASSNTPNQNPETSGAAEIGGVVEGGDTNSTNRVTQPASESNSGGRRGLQ